MEKFAKGVFPSNKGLFVHTVGELCGNFGEKTFFSHQSMLIPEELRKAVEKSLSETKENIEVCINGKENP